MAKVFLWDYPKAIVVAADEVGNYPSIPHDGGLE